MGAQVLDFPVPTAPAPVERPRLVLVPPLAEPSYRLTRRGRLVIAFLVALMIAALTVAVAGRMAGAAEPRRVITVQAGQTLSEIAAVELTDLPIRDGVVELQLANGLSTDQIHIGQTLTIPNR